MWIVNEQWDNPILCPYFIHGCIYNENSVLMAHYWSIQSKCILLMATMPLICLGNKLVIWLTILWCVILLKCNQNLVIRKDRQCFRLEMESKAIVNKCTVEIWIFADNGHFPNPLCKTLSILTPNFISQVRTRRCNHFWSRRAAACHGEFFYWIVLDSIWFDKNKARIFMPTRNTTTDYWNWITVIISVLFMFLHLSWSNHLHLLSICHETCFFNVPNSGIDFLGSSLTLSHSGNGNLRLSNSSKIALIVCQQNNLAVVTLLNFDLVC